MLQAGTAPQAERPAVLAAVNQMYDLSFNPSNGFFTLTGTNGTPTPPLLQIVVTEPNSSITITCTNGLFFETSAGSPVSWMPSNTLQNQVIESFDTNSIELLFPTAPQPWDRIGFTLNTRFTSGPNQTINDLQPELYVTAETLSPPPSLNLIYTPADGSFSLGGSMQDPIMDAEVAFRLGAITSNQGDGQIPVHLITAGDPPPSSEAIFAETAVMLSNNHTIRRHTNKTVILDIPFSNGSGVGMNFVIEYEGVTIHSPDPIIVDKTVGSNPGPGF